jgi:hypothetical protein
MLRAIRRQLTKSPIEPIKPVPPAKLAEVILFSVRLAWTCPLEFRAPAGTRGLQLVGTPGPE